MKVTLVKIIIALGAVLSLGGFITSPVALVLGMAIALIFGNPWNDKIKPAVSWCIAFAVVGLGAGIPLDDILRTGLHGILYTIVGIGFTFAAGFVLGKVLKIDRETSCLVTAGTAICGGSAIAAISQVIAARPESVAISLATVFLLNATALIIFPFIGHFFHLDQSQFGLWAGLAIHDTSSVVGAAMQYGDPATKIATTVKLVRAMWIAPVAFIIGLCWHQEEGRTPIQSILKRCWFIGGFLLMAVMTHYVEIFRIAAPDISAAAKHLMVLVLFMIGLGLTRELLRKVGINPFIQGVTLWVIVSATTLGAILMGWISL